jgi:hypothetical protein
MAVDGSITLGTTVLACSLAVDQRCFTRFLASGFLACGPFIGEELARPRRPKFARHEDELEAE